MKPKIVFVLTIPNEENVCLPVIEELKDRCDVLVIYDDKQNIVIPDELPAKVNKLSSYGDYNARNIIAKEAPEIIILAHDMSVISRIFINSAFKLDIPTIHVPHGILSPTLRKRREIIGKLIITIFSRQFLRDARMVLSSGLVPHFIKVLWSNFRHRYWGGHGGCSLICIRGKNDNDFLVRQGIKPEKLVITGDPQLDAISHLKTYYKKEDVRIRLKLKPGSKIVLILTQPFVEDKWWSARQRYFFITGILKAVTKLTDCIPIVKLHPRDNPSIYNTLLSDLLVESTIIVQNEHSLFDLLAACDVAVGVNSTTLLMAMLFDKPVIIANFFNESDYAGYISSGATIVTKAPDDMITALQSALHDEEARARLSKARSEFIYQQAYLQDGLAAKRIANLIMETIEQTKELKSGT